MVGSGAQLALDSVAVLLRARSLPYRIQIGRDLPLRLGGVTSGVSLGLIVCGVVSDVENSGVGGLGFGCWCDNHFRRVCGGGGCPVGRTRLSCW